MKGWGWGGAIASLSAHRTASRELFPANRCRHAASGVLLKVRRGGSVPVRSQAPFEDERLRLQTVEMLLHIRDTTWFGLGEIRFSAAGSIRRRAECCAFVFF